MNYPDIRGLILDATFDHLEPLAIPRMPAAMSPLVSRAVNKFINLNVAEQVTIFKNVLALLDYLSPQVSAFPGPVRLIRRNRDEMISTTEGELWSNRGNALLEAVLRSRYPGLATPEVLEQLAGVLYYPGALEAAGGQVQ